jgi:hypothetical protein
LSGRDEGRATAHITPGPIEQLADLPAKQGMRRPYSDDCNGDLISRGRKAGNPGLRLSAKAGSIDFSHLANRYQVDQDQTHDQD